jgi:NAD dependent epimerase/dehydratase
MTRDAYTWNSRSVLVTGAGGFIGSHLTEQLVRLGARTRALVRYNSAGSRGWLEEAPVGNEIEVIAGDVRDSDLVRSCIRDVDVVFHLAALIGIPYSYHAPLSYVRTNIEGTLNILQAAREIGVQRVIHTSTSEAYGSALSVPIREDHPLQGQSPYSASKIGADKLAEAFHLSFGLPVATIRPFNTFGPRQSSRAVIPTIITQALSGGPVRLGNLTPTRDLTFVGDTVEAFLAVGEVPDAVGKVINVGSGTEVSIEELARTILKLMDRVLPIVGEDERVRPGGSEVERLLADTRLARNILGWSPSTTLEEGLIRTIDWIGDHADRYRPDVYTV